VSRPSVWERIVPWLHDNELWVFLAPFAVLVLIGLCDSP
jgi:hypothetical protein